MDETEEPSCSYRQPQEMRTGRSIDDLPDEVLEFVLSMVPPYQDLQACMCVCRRWYDCSKTVMRKTSSKLEKAIAEFKIQWKNITPVDMAPTITKRFSHAACVHENSMYIFGGCTTNSTAFNDLWRFDLSKRQWIRPLAMGTYPVPKAYTSMVRYKDNLVLFGGWTYPSPTPYYQSITMYNEIHYYNVTNNRWILLNTANSPPQVAGHSAAIIGDRMIVFGGLIWRDGDIQCSNDVWVLDLLRMSWSEQRTSEPRPPGRYAQSLVVLDSDNVMIMGGVQSLNNRFTYNDCWTLNLTGRVWRWKEMAIRNKEWAAANIWCNPACRVGDKVVSLSRCKNDHWAGGRPLVTSAIRIRAPANPLHVHERVERSARRPIDRDHNVNGRRGTLPHQNNVFANRDGAGIGPRAGPSRESEDENEDSDGRRAKDGQGMRIIKTTSKIVRQLQEGNRFRMAAFACDPTQSAPENDLINQRHIAHLARRPDEPAAEADQSQQPAAKKQKRNTLTMHVLDISSVLNSDQGYVTWLCPREGEVSGAPEELVMYSLVRGNGELIMFGGVHNDINNIQCLTRTHQFLYSNSLHFITPPRDII